MTFISSLISRLRKRLTSDAPLLREVSMIDYYDFLASPVSPPLPAGDDHEE